MFAPDIDLPSRHFAAGEGKPGARKKEAELSVLLPALFYIISVSEGKIALYAIGDSSVYVDVVFRDETFWMTQKAITQLFEVDLSVISRHLKNIYAEEELSPEATIAKIAIVQNEGGHKVNRSPEFYSLDAIIAVGYRVNSKKATKFRQWAMQTLKEYMQKARIKIFHYFRNMLKYSELKRKFVSIRRY